MEHGKCKGRVCLVNGDLRVAIEADAQLFPVHDLQRGHLLGVEDVSLTQGGIPVHLVGNSVSLDHDNAGLTADAQRRLGLAAVEPALDAAHCHDTAGCCQQNGQHHTDIQYSSLSHCSSFFLSIYSKVHVWRVMCPLFCSLGRNKKTVIGRIISYHGQILVIRAHQHASLRLFQHHRSPGLCNVTVSRRSRLLFRLLSLRQ